MFILGLLKEFHVIFSVNKVGADDGTCKGLARRVVVNFAHLLIPRTSLLLMLSDI